MIRQGSEVSEKQLLANRSGMNGTSFTMQILEKKWHELYVEEHGLAPLTTAAAKAAGSWRELYKSKTLKLREVATFLTV